jgi:hypothetical protein
MPKQAKPKEPNLKAAVSSLRRYADSFEGLTMKKVRARLSAGKITHKWWEGHKQLVATSPKHEVRVFFLRDRALVTSVQVVSN